ncbi:ATP-binding protein [Candidatus Gottesmanbacteria bacterium]|nr:ATP-binding protein [Candidatus Gottesmanbacteria bacterium]
MKTIDLLERQNLWWSSPSYRPAEHTLPKRDAYPKLVSDVGILRQISGIVGLRRVGKSTLVKQVIAALLDHGGEPRRVMYFSFDEPAVFENKEMLEDVLEVYFKTILGESPVLPAAPVVIVLDEIQLVSGWQGMLKRYWDGSDKIKFVVTGSSSLFINTRARESLAGRIFVDVLPALSFAEYRALYPAGRFEQYLRYGGFPELLKLDEEARKQEYLRDWVIGKVIEVDVPKTAGVRHREDFERLFWAILPNTGQIIDLGRLGAELGIKKGTLYRYLGILEDALLLRRMTNVAGSFRSLSRRLLKLYPGSVNFLSVSPQSVGEGIWAECYVASLIARAYPDAGPWRVRQKEIDFVSKQGKTAIEVKYQPRVHDSDVAWLREYCQKETYRGIVLTREESVRKDGDLTFCPLEQWIAHGI